MQGRRPRSSYVPKVPSVHTRDAERLQAEIQAMALEISAKNAQIADLREQLRQTHINAQRPRMHLNQPDRFSQCQNEAFQCEVTKTERLRQQISQLERIKQLQFAALQQECQARADSAFQKAQKREAALEADAAGLRLRVQYLQEENQRLRDENQRLRARGAEPALNVEEQPQARDFSYKSAQKSDFEGRSDESFDGERAVAENE